MKNLTKITSLQAILTKTANLFRDRPKENIFYLHIPKCGGTSLNKALQSCYLKWSLSETSSLFNLDAPASWNAAQKSIGRELPPDAVDDSSVMKLREELLLYHMSQRHIRYISGHFAFSSIAYQNFSDKYAFITVLRNPVERWISSYLYNRHRQKHKYRQISMDINEYLESDFGHSQGYEYAKFLAGADEKGNYMSTQAIYRAKENLHKFRLIGFLEDMDSFRSQFKEQFGREISIGFLNQSPKSEKSEEPTVTKDMRKRIKEICQPDIEIYEYAAKNFL